MAVFDYDSLIRILVSLVFSFNTKWISHINDTYGLIYGDIGGNWLCTWFAATRESRMWNIEPTDCECLQAKNLPTYKSTQRLFLLLDE